MQNTHFITLSTPSIAGREWEYVKQCLDTGWISSAGSFVGRFEDEIAAYVGVQHAIAMSSGTAALHLALVVAGVEPQDEVLLPDLTFVATANAVRYIDAHPVFIDVHPKSWQISPEVLGEFLESKCKVVDGQCVNTLTGRRVRALLPVHLLGHPCDMDRLTEICAGYNLTVIEDNAEGLGSLYKDRATGSFGTLAALSFNGNKIMTCGGGGMVLTDDPELAQQVRHLSTQARVHAAEYSHDAVGYNYRLTNIAAALGVAQLERLPEMLERKREIADRYRRELIKEPGLEFFEEWGPVRSNFWLCAVSVVPETYGKSSARVRADLKNLGIEASPLFQPLSLQKPYRDCLRWGGDASVRIYERALCLPSSAHLTAEQQGRVLDALVRSATNGN